MYRYAVPVLHVSSASAAEEFYCKGLGFRRVSAMPNDGATLTDPCYVELRRDDVTMHISSFPGDGVSGGVVFLLVDDVDVLHKELVRKGIRIDLKPTEQTWGNREMYVKDADLNSIRFVQLRSSQST